MSDQMWSDDNGAYHGKHFTLEETLCSPQPVSRPRPPILIGGSGEKKTLRLVAQYADAVNIITSPDQFAHKIDVRGRVNVDHRATGSGAHDHADVQRRVLQREPLDHRARRTFHPLPTLDPRRSLPVVATARDGKQAAVVELQRRFTVGVAIRVPNANASIFRYHLLHL